MNWQVLSRPEAETDIIEIAAWYDSRRDGLGNRFVEEVLSVLDQLSVNQNERVVVVAAVSHAARHEREWKGRV